MVKHDFSLVSMRSLPAHLISHKFHDVTECPMLTSHSPTRGGEYLETSKKADMTELGSVGLTFEFTVTIYSDAKVKLSVEINMTTA